MTGSGGAEAVRLARRLATIWLVDTAAFALLAALLPGVSLSSPFGALAVVFWIGVLNVTLRPLLLALSIRFPLPLAMVLAFVLNVLAIRQADRLVDSVHVAHDLWGTAVALGMGALNAWFSGLLGITEDDSFYRHVIARRLARRSPSPAPAGPCLLVVQIDGLSEPALRRALSSGRMPHLARWLAQGSHRLTGWQCDIPSMTTTAQAGILHGRTDGIPAFRWYDRAGGRLVISNNPRDAHQLDTRLTSPAGLLAVDGSSIGNVFRAGAAHHALTMSGLLDGGTRFGVRGRDLYPFLLNPYTYGRGAARMVWELVLEYGQGLRQWLRGGPRPARGGAFPLLRVVVNVLMRDITVWLAIDDIYSGRRVSYIDLLGYDEVAHHAGPLTGDALAVLRGIDKAFRLFEVAARNAPRPVQIVVLSDHGQSAGVPFARRYGEPLDAVVARLLAGSDVQAAGGHDEGWGRLNATLTAATQAPGTLGRTTRRVLSDRMAGGLVQLGPPPAEVARADVVVCTSGNLAHLYFTGHPARLTSEQLAALAPGLITGLRTHPGIGFVVVIPAGGEPLALGAAGERNLATGAVHGVDPLAGLPPATVLCFARLAGYAESGDVIINSMVDPATGEVAAFEDLAGSHGGAGGDQTAAFIAYPADWPPPAGALIGAEAVHQFLRAHLAAGG